MTSPTTPSTALAYETAGIGTPVVLLHGLTFDRTSWRPIVDELDGSLHTVAIDLPAHGASPGPPLSVEQLSERVHDQLAALGIVRALIVGHSFGAAVASMYTARYPTLGLVIIDNGPYLQPFAELVHHMAPALQGPRFADAWSRIEGSLGLDLIPEPAQTLVRAGHRVEQDVVLGYWAQLLTTPPTEFQSYVDSFASAIDVPVLAVYGTRVPDGDRDRFDRLPDVRLEEHPGQGHFVHLVNPARFAESLRRFVTYCTTTA